MILRSRGKPLTRQSSRRRGCTIGGRSPARPPRAVRPRHLPAGEDQGTPSHSTRRTRVAVHRHVAEHGRDLQAPQFDLAAGWMVDAGSGAVARMVAPFGTSMVRPTWTMRTLKLMLREGFCFDPPNNLRSTTSGGPSTPPDLPTGPLPGSLDRGVLPSLLGCVIRRRQSGRVRGSPRPSTKRADARRAGSACSCWSIATPGSAGRRWRAPSASIVRPDLVPILDRLQSRGFLVRHRSADRWPHPCPGADGFRAARRSPASPAWSRPREAHRLRPFGVETRTPDRLAGKVYRGRVRYSPRP